MTGTAATTIQPGDSAGLDQLNPEPVKAPARGEELSLYEVPLGRLGDFARAARPLLPLLALLATEESDPAIIYEDLFAQHDAALRTFLTLGCDKPAAWVSGLGHADAIVLLTGVFRANRSFFALLFKSRLLKAARINRGTGQTPSTSSSAPATA